MTSYDPNQYPPAPGQNGPTYPPAQQGYQQPGYQQPGYQQQGYPPVSPQPDGDQGGAKWALPLAIAVTAVQFILIPVLYIVLVVVTITQTAAVTGSVLDEYDDLNDDSSSSDVPSVALGWDDEFTGTDVFVDETFEDAGWTVTSKDGLSYLGYDNPENGCTVWYDYGSLDSTIDVSAGDRDASIALLDYLTGETADPAAVDDYELTTDNYLEQGTAAAVVSGSASDASVDAIVARAFGDAGVGVYASISCPDAASLESTLNELPDLITLSIY